jgi:hypothetical protein
MTTKPPPPFFWTPYLCALSIIVLMMIWPFVFMPLLREEGETSAFVAMAMWMVITLPLGVISFLVWLIKLLVHRRADREWLATHDA